MRLCCSLQNRKNYYKDKGKAGIQLSDVFRFFAGHTEIFGREFFDGQNMANRVEYRTYRGGLWKS